MGDVPAGRARGVAAHHGPEPHAAEQPTFFCSRAIKSPTSKEGLLHSRDVDLLKLVRKCIRRASAKEGRSAAALEKCRRPSQAQGGAKQFA